MAVTDPTPLVSSDQRIISIERRAALRNTRGFVTKTTVDLLAEKMLGLIGDRRMVKTHQYLGDSHVKPTIAVGLRINRGSYQPVRHQPGQGAGVHLCGGGGRMFEGLSFHVGCRDESEDEVAHRYHNPADQWLGQRRDMTLVELTGWPGSPGREDEIRVEYWNENGVGQETIVVFDDVDFVQEIAWDVKRDLERRVHIYDAFCDEHGLHFEHPDHKGYGCTGRKSTRAEDLEVLAFLDRSAVPGD